MHIRMNISSLMKHIFFLLVATVFLAGCDFFSSEPV
ncbi:lipoprotein [Caballeronia sp. HLA56]